MWPGYRLVGLLTVEMHGASCYMGPHTIPRRKHSRCLSIATQEGLIGLVNATALRTEVDEDVSYALRHV